MSYHGFNLLSSLYSKKVKLSGVVTEDKMTGDRYVTHMTTMEDTVGARQPGPEQTDSQSTSQGQGHFVLCCIYIVSVEQRISRFLSEWTGL